MFGIFSKKPGRDAHTHRSDQPADSKQTADQRESGAQAATDGSTTPTDTPAAPGNDADPGSQAASICPASPDSGADAVIGEPARPTPIQPFAADTTTALPPAPTQPPTTVSQADSAAARDHTRSGFGLGALARGLGALFARKPRLDETLFDDIETALLTADVGIDASSTLIAGLRKRHDRGEFTDGDGLLRALRDELLALLNPVARPLVIDPSAAPFVILTIGINGAGKTTTIGKLAHRFKRQGYHPMLAAGDTFRAAAVAQLKTWGERNGIAVVAQTDGADPAAVTFDALKSAKARGNDILIADTAGRLHTQAGLMAELAKVGRVLGKLDPRAPHEVLMVLDGSIGQNAINQVREFNRAIPITGLVITKLDGTAKGGVLLALARQFAIPIRFVGMGEKLDDLIEFEPRAFVDALLPAALGGSP